jgi:hypothetical protein
VVVEGVGGVVVVVGVVGVVVGEGVVDDVSGAGVLVVVGDVPAPALPELSAWFPDAPVAGCDDEARDAWWPACEEPEDPGVA